jgi:hypothetical protein
LLLYPEHAPSKSRKPGNFSKALDGKMMREDGDFSGGRWRQLFESNNQAK